MTVIEERPHLCGVLLVSDRDGACNPARPAIQDEEMRSHDPGFCALERRCVTRSAAGRTS